MTTALITGCSSGFGRAAAALFAERGVDVFGTVRTSADAEELRDAGTALGATIEPVLLDVTDATACAAATEMVVERTGTLDVLVNNAGRVLYAAVEETTGDEASALFDVNFFGPLTLIREVLPIMRRQRRGAIVNVSSVNGIINLPFSGLYGASKWALEAVTQALQLEVAEYGITASIVQPAGFLTAIVANAADAELPNPDSAYWEGLQRAREASRSTNADSPDLTPVAEAIWAAAFDEDYRLRHPVGHFADLLSRLRRDLDDEALLDVMRTGVRNAAVELDAADQPST